MHAERRVERMQRMPPMLMSSPRSSHDSGSALACEKEKAQPVGLCFNADMAVTSADGTAPAAVTEPRRRLGQRLPRDHLIRLGFDLRPKLQAGIPHGHKRHNTAAVPPNDGLLTSLLGKKRPRADRWLGDCASRGY